MVTKYYQGFTSFWGQSNTIQPCDLNYCTRTGCLKKNEFYRIEHLLIGFPPCCKQYVSIYKLFFCSFLTKTQHSQSQVMQMGKLGPTATNFGYSF